VRKGKQHRPVGARFQSMRMNPSERGGAIIKMSHMRHLNAGDAKAQISDFQCGLHVGWPGPAARAPDAQIGDGQNSRCTQRKLKRLRACVCSGQRLAAWTNPTVTPPSTASGSQPSSTVDESGTLWFTQEVHSHDASLRSYLRDAFPAVRDLDDVVQESYLRIWKARAARPINSAKAFLFTVARHLALNTLRRERRSPIIAVKDLSRLFVPDHSPDASAAAALAQEIELLVSAIAVLPPRCREIFILRRLRGVPQKEIALCLGVSEQTVQVQASRGLRRIELHLRRTLRPS
jgi:RNA polymerase sigma factor (sigma-70 family)